MPIIARYVHTNLIASDWRRLASFYQEVFGCRIVPPERDFSGPDLEAGTGLPGARMQGAHLALPGYPAGGPTLEIFQYQPSAAPRPARINQPGYGHIAFEVPDVYTARAAVEAAGGEFIGQVVTLETSAGARVTWCYVRDPEGNPIELQSWEG